MAIDGMDERKYAYGAPSAPSAQPTVYDAFQKIQNSGQTPVSSSAALDWWKSQNYAIPKDRQGSTTINNAYRTMLDQGGANSAPTLEDIVAGLAGALGGGGGGGGGVDNRNAIINALRQRMNADPYASLRAALERNAAGAQQTGAQAIAALRSQIGQMQNPYANVKFNTPMPATNPLAAYMQQSGASADQVNALSDWLGSLSANAAAADQQMADRMSLSTQNDIQQRLADAGFSEAAFRQALAQNLAAQQGALDLQKSQYQNDIAMQLAQLGATA